MKKGLKAIACIMSITLLLLSLASCKAPVKTGDIAVLPERQTSTEEIFLFDRNNVGEKEYILLTTLQGIVAQRESKIYLKDNDNIVYLQRYLAEHPEVQVKEFTDLWELVQACSSELSDKGCILFDEGNNTTVNMAATIAGVEKWLAVPNSLKEDALAAGLQIKRDLTEKENGHYKVTQEDIFEEYKDKLNRNFLVHQSPELVTLRDYAVAAGAFCFYTDEDNRADVKFRDMVFAWANQNAPVFGWSTDELAYVKQASQNGLFIIPSDHCTNLSFLSGWDKKADMQQKAKSEVIQADESKHYIALIMSDGDNVQWYETSLPFAGHFKDRVETAHDYKLNWTAPPLLKQLAPSVMSMVYDMATENDMFIAGVSGMGYINPTNYPEEYLESFVSESIKAAEAADLQVFATLDNTTSQRKLTNAMTFYAGHSEINGGFMQIEEKYEALSGKILWCGDKPFISVRKSFWYTEKDNPNAQATKEYIEQFAAEINALPADIHSADGYSYINIHPWSTSMEDLNTLVSLLDDHIEIVFADELLQLVRENVEH